MKITSYSSCHLPTEFGTFDLELFRLDENPSEELLLISLGDLAEVEDPFVRMHSECFTGETLLSLKCDCRAQLEFALQTISEEGQGALLYLRQEGRGIGLANKILAYAEQEKGADTIEANEHLGFPADLRDYSAATEILRQKGVTQVRLHTNNPEKMEAVRHAGIEIVEVLPATSNVNAHNKGYLRTKLERMGHAGLGNLPELKG
ncbi:MAG: GTP cyclohydrolase II [Verrucomicrobiota bacterium]